MRFQDAAPDARAVVYAGIQADPLVARAAALLADATQGERILARAVMNGTSTDAAAWRAMFPTVFGGAEATGDDRPPPCAAERGEETDRRRRQQSTAVDRAYAVEERAGAEAPADDGERGRRGRERRPPRDGSHGSTSRSA